MKTSAIVSARATRESRLQEIRREAEANHVAGISGESLRSKDDVQASATTGYYGRPVLKEPAWTIEVPLYFFVGGAAGAAAVIASAGKLCSADEELIRDARWLAAIGGAISPALLIADLGVPSRFLNMLRVFKIRSPMSVGSWTLVAFSSSAAAATVLGEFERRFRRKLPILTGASETISALTGLVLATYTGVLIGATVIPAWNENVSSLPIHFAASGTGAAVSILELRGHNSSALNKIGIGAAVVETAMGASLELKRTQASEPLRVGASGWALRAAGVLSGPVPLALRLLAGSSKKRGSMRLRRAAAVSSIMGSALTRFAWIQAGKVSARDPRVPLQLKRTPALPGDTALPAPEKVTLP